MKKPNVIIEHCLMRTTMGTTTYKPTWFTDCQFADLNEIGRSGTLHGKKMTRQQYLDTLPDAAYKIDQVEYDDGSFREAFWISRVTKPPKPKEC